MGWGLIEQVEDLLLSGARARDVKDVVVGEVLHLKGPEDPAALSTIGG